MKVFTDEFFKRNKDFILVIEGEPFKVKRSRVELLEDEDGFKYLGDTFTFDRFGSDIYTFVLTSKKYPRYWVIMKEVAR